MVASDFQHFLTLFRKCLTIELDSPSKYFWNIGILFFAGFVFGLIARNMVNMAYVVSLVAVFTFFQCGFVGKMIATNLVRDRTVKFRLTLQLVGVKQSVYMAANIIFAILYGLIQIILLIVFIYFFAMVFGINNQVGASMGIKLDFNLLGTFMINSICFLLAYLAMCAAFSGLITQYDFASEIIGKFTFISIFVPVAYVASSFITALAYLDVDRMARASRIDWRFCWLPNMAFLNQGVSVVLGEINRASTSVVIFDAHPPHYFTLLMLGQFVGYLILYFLIDRLFSTDTGGQRKIIGAANSTLQDESLMDGEDSPSQTS